jgi:hypothetical protein
MQERQERSVMIGGQRVKAGVNIGEVLLEKEGSPARPHQRFHFQFFSVDAFPA